MIWCTVKAHICINIYMYIYLRFGKYKIDDRKRSRDARTRVSSDNRDVEIQTASETYSFQKCNIFFYISTITMEINEFCICNGNFKHFFDNVTQVFRTNKASKPVFGIRMYNSK